MRHWIAAAAALILARSPVFAAASRTPASQRRALSRIAECLGRLRRQTLRSAAPRSPLLIPGCLHATVVAAGEEDFVLEDLKMYPYDGKSGCRENGTPAAPAAGDLVDYPYVHLLAIPFSRITGDEDPKALSLTRIWSDAWDAAAGFIPDERQRLLAVNPPAERSQDQLHIHIMRLKGNVRFAAAERVDDLGGSSVWTAAARSARKLGLKPGSFGIAVARDPGGKGYRVAAVGGSPERRFGRLCAD